MNKKSDPDASLILRKREEIGSKLRTLRELKRLSQDDLAEIMQVHRSTISKIETGKFSATIDYLLKFGWYLDFDIELNATTV